MGLGRGIVGWIKLGWCTPLVGGERRAVVGGESRAVVGGERSPVMDVGGGRTVTGIFSTYVADVTAKSERERGRIG